MEYTSPSDEIEVLDEDEIMPDIITDEYLKTVGKTPAQADMESMMILDKVERELSAEVLSRLTRDAETDETTTYIRPVYGLNPKEIIFCKAYVRHHNMLRAFLDAGFTKLCTTMLEFSTLTPTQQANVRRCAAEVGKRPQVVYQICKYEMPIESETIATGKEVMEFFTAVMRGEIKDQFGLDPSLADRINAAKECAKRTIDIRQKLQLVKAEDAPIKITLNWKR